MYMDKEVRLGSGEEKFFPVNSLVSFSARAAKFARDFVEKHEDPGPYMVLKSEGFPPGHNLRDRSPQKITIAVNGNPIPLPGSLFAPY